MGEIKLLRSIAARLTVIENRLDQQQPVLNRRGGAAAQRTNNNNNNGNNGNNGNHIGRNDAGGDRRRRSRGSRGGAHRRSGRDPDNDVRPDGRPRQAGGNNGGVNRDRSATTRRGGGSGARRDNNVRPHRDPRSGITCRYFKDNCCRNGDRCPYRHPPEDQLWSTARGAGRKGGSNNPHNNNNNNNNNGGPRHAAMQEEHGGARNNSFKNLHKNARNNNNNNNKNNNNNNGNNGPASSPSPTPPSKRELLRREYGEKLRNPNNKDFIATEDGRVFKVFAHFAPHGVARVPASREFYDGQSQAKKAAARNGVRVIDQLGQSWVYKYVDGKWKATKIAAARPAAAPADAAPSADAAPPATSSTPSSSARPTAASTAAPAARPAAKQPPAPKKTTPTSSSSARPTAASNAATNADAAAGPAPASAQDPTTPRSGARSGAENDVVRPTTTANNSTGDSSEKFPDLQTAHDAESAANHLRAAMEETKKAQQATSKKAAELKLSEEKLAELQKKLNAIREERDAARAAVVETDKASRVAVDAALAKERAESAPLLAAAKRDADESARNLDTKRAELKTARDALTKQQQQLTDAQGRLRKMEQERAELLETVDAAREQRNHFKNQLAESTAAEEASKSHSRDLEQKLSRAEEKLQSKTRELEQAQSSVPRQTVTKQLEAKQRELEALRDTLSASELKGEELGRKCVRLEHEIESSRKYVSEYAMLQSKMQAEQRKHVTTTRTLEEVRAELDVERRAHQEMQMRNAQLDGELIVEQHARAAAEDRCRGLQRQFTEQTGTLRQQQVEAQATQIRASSEARHAELLIERAQVESRNAAEQGNMMHRQCEDMIEQTRGHAERMAEQDRRNQQDLSRTMADARHTLMNAWSQKLQVQGSFLELQEQRNGLQLQRFAIWREGQQVEQNRALMLQDFASMRRQLKQQYIGCRDAIMHLLQAQQRPSLSVTEITNNLLPPVVTMCQAVESEFKLLCDGFASGKNAPLVEANSAPGGALQAYFANRVQQASFAVGRVVDCIDVAHADPQQKCAMKNQLPPEKVLADWATAVAGASNGPTVIEPDDDDGDLQGFGGAHAARPAA
jgi:hypothetical protein